MFFGNEQIAEHQWHPSTRWRPVLLLVLRRSKFNTGPGVTWWLTHCTHSPLQVNVVVTHCHCEQTQIIHIVFTRHNIHLYVHVATRTPPSARSAFFGDQVSSSGTSCCCDPAVCTEGEKEENLWLLRLHYRPAALSAAQARVAQLFDSRRFWPLWPPQTGGAVGRSLAGSSRLPLLVYQGSSSSKKNSKWFGENVANQKRFARGW